MPIPNWSAVSRPGAKTKKAGLPLGGKSGSDIVKDTGEKAKSEAERPTLEASKEPNYQLELRELLTLNMPYLEEGYDYSWLGKKGEDLLEGGAVGFMTSGLPGDSLIYDFLTYLGWETMDSLADQDISPSKKKLINHWKFWARTLLD